MYPYIHMYVCSIFYSVGVFFFFWLQVLREVEELIKVKKETVCDLGSTFIIALLIFIYQRG